MKKLLLLLFFAIGLSFVVQSIPAPDRDVGTATCIMPTFQIDQHFAVAMLPTMQTLYLDTGRATIGQWHPSTKQSNQCLLPVVPPYKGPMSVVQVNDNQQYTGANFI